MLYLTICINQVRLKLSRYETYSVLEMTLLSVTPCAVRWSPTSFEMPPELIMVSAGKQLDGERKQKLTTTTADITQLLQFLKAPFKSCNVFHNGWRQNQCVAFSGLAPFHDTLSRQRSIANAKCQRLPPKTTYLDTGIQPKGMKEGHCVRAGVLVRFRPSLAYFVYQSLRTWTI